MTDSEHSGPVRPSESHGGTRGQDAAPREVAVGPVTDASPDTDSHVPLAQQYADLPPAPETPAPIQMEVLTGQVPADAHIYGKILTPGALARARAEAEAAAAAEAESALHGSV